MKLSIGIVGLPNVGKSTLFKLMTSQEILIANYPFATIDPNVGVVPVPDERLDALTKLSSSKKRVPAVVEFYDIAGLVKGANQGEGLGNQFLQHIKETQAIVIVLRVFQDDSIIHVENSVDPLRDLEILNAELALKDLDTVEKRMAKLEGEARAGVKSAAKSLEILTQVKEKLNRSELVQDLSEEEVVKELNLLTAKKQMYLLNGKEEDVTPALKDKLPEGSYVIKDLGGATDVNDLIKKGYEILDLISFLTTGEEESRAWTIKRGAKAPEAAGAIHTDFEKKFIRAEVVNWQKLVELGGWTPAKQKGLIRLEGKDYVVQDGDVMVIRHG
jgi:ribosome-binding ATPase